MIGWLLLDSDKVREQTTQEKRPQDVRQSLLPVTPTNQVQAPNTKTQEAVSVSDGCFAVAYAYGSLLLTFPLSWAISLAR
jgi:hypothetical protein